MTQFVLQKWPTRAGLVASYSVASAAGGDRPVVLVLHGALRTSALFVHWVELLADVADVVLMDLPGHGRSEADGPATVAGMAQAVHEAIAAALPGRDVFIMGESIGGTVALAIAALPDPCPVRAVFAADPPMTTGKLWNVVGTFRRAMASAPEGAFIRRFGRETFGVTPEGVEEIIYYPFIGDAKAPVTIATGDIPLLPPRQMNGVACVFDAVDWFVVETLYPGRARLERISNCGHLVLFDGQAACARIVRGILSAHYAARSEP